MPPRPTLSLFPASLYPYPYPPPYPPPSPDPPRPPPSPLAGRRQPLPTPPHWGSSGGWAGAAAGQAGPRIARDGGMWVRTWLLASICIGTRRTHWVPWSCLAVPPPPPAMDILGHVRAPSVGGQCLGRGVGGFSRPLSIPAFLSLLCLFGLVPPTPPSPRAIPALQGPKTKKPSTTQQAQSKHQHLPQDPGCSVGPQCGFCIVLAPAAPMSTEKLNLRRVGPSLGLSHSQGHTPLGH